MRRRRRRRRRKLGYRQYVRCAVQNYSDHACILKMNVKNTTCSFQTNRLNVLFFVYVLPFLPPPFFIIRSHSTFPPSLPLFPFLPLPPVPPIVSFLLRSFFHPLPPPPPLSPSSSSPPSSLSLIPYFTIPSSSLHGATPCSLKCTTRILSKWSSFLAFLYLVTQLFFEGN